MLGGAGTAGGVVQVLQGYESVLDELLRDRDDGGSGDVGTQWIGTEEDVLVLMMLRDASLFALIRSGVLCCMGCCKRLLSPSIFTLAEQTSLTSSTTATCCRWSSVMCYA